MISGGDAQGDTVNGFYNIIGSNFDDTLSGNASSNIFIGGGGNDTITGNGGVDEVWYNGDAEDYAISAQQDGSFIVKDLRATRPDGIDTLRDINALSFWNRRVTLT
jgi:Ca2+-binding RTX toxin-like protein